MTDDPIPARVRRLLKRHFRSVSQVEAFVLLVRVPRPWTAEDVAADLGLGARHVEGLLDDLVSARLLARDGRCYELANISAERRQAAEELATLYTRYRLRIMEIVFESPRDQARDFADAFRLRPADDPEEDE